MRQKALPMRETKYWVCDGCGARFRPTVLKGGALSAEKHQASVHCQAKTVVAVRVRAGWAECGAASTTIAKAGFEVIRVKGRVEQDYRNRHKFPPLPVNVLVEIAMARRDVVLAANKVARISHMGRWGLVGKRRWVLIRKVHADPAFAEVLEAVARLGAKPTKEWFAETAA